MKMPRRISRKIKIGNVEIGGGAPVSLQSMTNTSLRDVPGTIAQVERLAALGCQIIRIAVDDTAGAEAFGQVVKASPIPVIADIQFNYRSALDAMTHGASAIRINPGIISEADKLRAIAHMAVEKNIPIRVGANSGSISTLAVRDRIANGMAHDDAIATELVECALKQCRALEENGVTQIKVALKSTSVPITINACRRLAALTDYPIHIGITEAGTLARGIVKSAVGIGALLMEGIGDTLRVSLTAPPEEEIITGRRILEACGLRDAMPEIVSCPTCGRTEIDLPGLAERVETMVNEIKSQGYEIRLKKLAVMGCPVNGPGEARDADLGIAGTRNGKVILFRLGETIGAFEEDAGFEYFKAEVLKQCVKP